MFASLAALTLAAITVQSPPDTAIGEQPAPASETSEPGSPAPAGETSEPEGPAPASGAPVVAPAPTPAPVVVPRGRGTAGLIVGSVAGGIGLGLGLASAGFQSQCYRLSCDEGDILFPVLAYNFHFIAIVSLAAGGGLRGRWEARRDLAAGVTRKRSIFLPIGAAVLAVGGAMAIGGLVGQRFSGPDRDPGGLTAMSHIGFSTFAAGAGLASYGGIYRNNLKKLQVRVVPQFAPGLAGLAFVGRF